MESRRWSYCRRKSRCEADGREGFAVVEDKGLVVAVDVALTPELVSEGLARDLVRRVQSMRKDAGLQLSDRIVLFYETESPWTPS